MEEAHEDNRKVKDGLKELHGETVLDNEAGDRFYHKHLSKKAKARKRKATKIAKRSRKQNR